MFTHSELQFAPDPISPESITFNGVTRRIHMTSVELEGPHSFASGEFDGIADRDFTQLRYKDAPSRVICVQDDSEVVDTPYEGAGWAIIYDPTTNKTDLHYFETGNDSHTISFRYGKGALVCYIPAGENRGAKLCSETQPKYSPSMEIGVDMNLLTPPVFVPEDFRRYYNHLVDAYFPVFRTTATPK